MDLAEVVRVIRARWYVLLPLLLLTMALAVGVDKSIPTKYQSTSSISLLSSQSATSGTTALPGTNNPFLNFNSSLNDTADFLVRRLGSVDATNDLASRGVTETFSIVLAAGAQGPFITLAVTGTNREHVLTSMNTLIEYTEQELVTVQQQAGIKSVDMIRSTLMTPPAPPSAQTKTKTQDVLGVGIGGLVVTFLATFLADNVITSRRRRSRASRPGATQPGTQGRGGSDDGGDGYAVAEYEYDREDDYAAAAGYGADGYGADGYGANGTNGHDPVRDEAGQQPATAPIPAAAPRRNGRAARRAPAEAADGAARAEEDGGLSGSGERPGLGGSRWYGLEGESALERDAFEPARPELTGRGAPAPRD